MRTLRHGNRPPRCRGVRNDQGPASGPRRRVAHGLRKELALPAEVMDWAHVHRAIKAAKLGVFASRIRGTRLRIPGRAARARGVSTETAAADGLIARPLVRSRPTRISPDTCEAGPWAGQKRRAVSTR